MSLAYRPCFWPTIYVVEANGILSQDLRKTSIIHQLSKHANVYISAADNQYDVEEFVKKEVGEAMSSGRLLGGREAISDSLREKIISTLTGGAQGM